MMDFCKDDTGVKISKNAIALITLTIILLTTVSTAVAYTVGVKTSVEQLDDDVKIIKEQMEEIDPKIHNNEMEIAVIKAHYENIDLNIKEIKNTLKENGQYNCR